MPNQAGLEGTDQLATIADLVAEIVEMGKIAVDEHNAAQDKAKLELRRDKATFDPLAGNRYWDTVEKIRLTWVARQKEIKQKKKQIESARIERIISKGITLDTLYASAANMQSLKLAIELAEKTIGDPITLPYSE
jgi:hypothetical protein